MKQCYSFFVLLLIFFSTVHYHIMAQCSANEIMVTVSITPDNYPNEISWNIKTAGGTIIANGGAVGTTLCLPDNGCYTFTIFDSFGDGICCAFGNGSYSLTVDGVLIASGGNYTYSEATSFNCPQGTICTHSFVANTGVHLAPNSDTWYTFQPSVSGMYEITTCHPNNTCDTKIWVYETCSGLVWDNSNVSTLYYDDNNGGCGLQAVVSAALAASQTYIIRIGDNNGACGSAPINWEIIYNGPISGCMDVAACNYNPLATVSSGTCYYWPDSNCPGGPDLVILQAPLENSLYIDHVVANGGDCRVAENCLTGYGSRTILRFTTWIKNIGDADYFIGNPVNNPGQFSFVNCHNHAHYEGYAEYVLFRNNGNPIPIGFKNGFCVMDLECSDGGTAKYGCNNMGITAQCGDIYSAGLECQWIDITDVDAGDYILAVRINWDFSADALGVHETDYSNNWAQVCITITDVNGVKGFVLNPNCSDYIDCNGTPFGSAIVDCDGNCGGIRVTGDMNLDLTRDLDDANLYVSGILNNTINVQPCTDLNNDGIISVWDAALVQECFFNGTPYNNACVFPHGITSPNASSFLSIGNVNSAQNYIDIYIQNPNNFVRGYEFNLSGLSILNVLPLYNTTNYTATPQFNNSGKIIGLANTNSYLHKNTNPEPFLRVYYSNLSAYHVCISDIVHFVNNEFYAIDIDTINNCKQLQFANIDEVSTNNYLFIAPNPTAEIANIEAFVSAKNANISITNIMGQEISKIDLTDAYQKIALDVSDYAKGIYLIKLQAGSFQRIYKLVKE